MTSIPEWLKTDHPREVIEAALAHVVRNRVEAGFVIWPLISLLAIPMFGLLYKTLTQ